MYLLVISAFLLLFGAPISGTVLTVEVRVPLGMEEEGIREIIEMKPGMPYSKEAVDNDVKRLGLMEKFKDIQVQASQKILPTGEKGIALVYVLTPKTFIREIGLEGNHALTRDDLLSAMDIREGSEFRRDAALKEDLAQWARAVKEAYRRKGYSHADVSFKTETLEGGVRLIIVISENYPVLTAEVLFRGDIVYPEETLKKAVPLKVGGVASEDILDEAVLALRNLYRKDGYWGVSFEKPSVALLASGMDAQVVFSITAGEQYRVSFTGNRKFRDSRLMKFIDPEGGIAIEYWAERMEKLYRENGFLFARVLPSLSSVDHQKNILFTIDEGKKVRLTSVSFQGNKTIPSEDLMTHMETRPRSIWVGISDFFSESEKKFNGVYLEERFRDDMKAVLFQYQRQGFLEAKVEDVKLDFYQEKTRLRVTVFIDEGLRTFLEGVDLEGVHSLPDNELREALLLTPEDPLDLFAVDQGNKVLTAHYRKAGFPLARTDARVLFAKNSTKARVIYTVQEGPRFTVGKIIVQGTDKTKDYVITREVTARSGDPYTQDAIVESRQKLTRLGYFDRVTIVPVDRDGTKDILIKVQEGNTAQVSVGAGYGTVDGLRGFIEGSENNITGRGRAATLRLDGADDIIRYSQGENSFADSINEYKASLGYREPYLFRTKVRGRADLTHQYENRRYVGFSIKRNSGLIGIEHAFSDSTKGALLYEFEIRRLTGASLTITAPGEPDLIQLAVLTPVIIFDFRDDPFNPRRGQIWSFQTEWAETLLGSRESFVKSVGKWGYFNPIFDSVIGSVVVRAGYGFPYRNSRAIPIERRFFTGGANSIRGFVEDSVGPRAGSTPSGGTILLNLTLEARAPLWGSLGLALFTDWGNVWEDPGHFYLGRWDDVRKSAGLGLRYKTPIGPLRADLGFKLDRREKEPLLGFHFFIGNIF